jgi:acetylglutamate kinase
MQTLVEKAKVLIEALPYIQTFRGATFVIKCGGSFMENQDAVRSMLQDVVFLESVGINPVLVHGGGKAITERMKAAGIQARFVNGMRVTDAASMNLVEEVLSTILNPELVKTIESLRGKARGIPGKEVIHAKQLNPELGFVGDIVSVDAKPLLGLLRNSITPVISPIGRDKAGQVYNINADVAAADVAIALKARRLVYLSDVNGLRRVPTQEDSLISTLHVSEVPTLIQDGVIDGGMLPKVQSSVRAIEAGVHRVHMIDGRQPHSLLLEVFTDKGIGTEIVK